MKPTYIQKYYTTFGCKYFPVYQISLLYNFCRSRVTKYLLLPIYSKKGYLDRFVGPPLA